MLHKIITNSPSAQLALIAGLSGLIYLLLFTLPFPLPRLYNIIPPVDYTKLTGYTINGLLAYVFGLGVLFWLYVWAVRLTLPDGARGPATSDQPGPPLPVSRWLIFGTSAMLTIVLLFSYPVTAIDLFIYAIRTRGWALYGLNPLQTAPEMLPAADPWLGLAAEWLDAPSPYGPAWEWLSLAAFYLSGGVFLNHLLALKIVGVLAYLGCTGLTYQILHKFRPHWAAAGALAFAWNPLSLLESVQNGHNDVVMTFWLLAAVWALQKITRPAPDPERVPAQFFTRWTFLALLFLALSILVKFVTILVAPILLLALASAETAWPKRLLRLGAAGLVLALFVILPILPLWPGWENWAVPQAGSGAGRSLLALLILSFKDAWGVNFAFDFSRNLLLIVYGLIYLFYLIHSHKPTQTLADVLPPVFWVLFWYVLLAAPVFHAWYLLWFLPLTGLLLPQRRPFLAATLFSITALFIIPYFETVRVWYPILLANQFLGHLLGVLLLIGPPLLALLWPISPSFESEV